MALLFIAASVLALAGLGVFITVNLARRVPLEVLDLAQRHGRFAHLAVEQRHSGPIRAVRADRPAAAGSLHPA